MPAAAPGGNYTVQPGESFGGIARKHKVKSDELALLNGITDTAKIKQGQVLRIPGPGAHPAVAEAGSLAAASSVAAPGRAPAMPARPIGAAGTKVAALGTAATGVSASVPAPAVDPSETAAAAQGLLVRRPRDSALVERLAAHASEELRHFRQVHRLLVELGGALEPPRRNGYAEGLLACVERGSLLDRLLVFALIERRSLERFELLAAVALERGGSLAALGELYAELAPSEAGHAALFLELARATAGPAEVEPRLARWVAREGALAAVQPFAPRIHSGPPLLHVAHPVEEALAQ